MLVRDQALRVLGDGSVEADEEVVGPPASLGGARDADRVVEAGGSTAGLPDHRRRWHLVTGHILVVAWFLHALDEPGDPERREEVHDDLPRLARGEALVLGEMGQGAGATQVLAEAAQARQVGT